MMPLPTMHVGRDFGRARQRPALNCAPRRPKRGFTFVETLVALLILVLLTTFVASGIPAAISTYRQVESASNAQVALSTTLSALRDELGLATDVKAQGDNVYYRTSDGAWAQIQNGGVGLVKHVYAADGPDSIGAEVAEDQTELIPSAAIVGASGGGGLRVQMSGITYDETEGVFTVHGVQVLMDGTVIEGVGDDKNGDYKVKVVLSPTS